MVRKGQGTQAGELFTKFLPFSWFSGKQSPTFTVPVELWGERGSAV